MAAWELNILLNREWNKSERHSQVSDEIIRLLRASSLNRPWAVLRSGKNALITHKKTNQDYWEILSDMCRAASECGDFQTVERLLRYLCNQFPSSPRCEVLHGLLLESQGKRMDAMGKYMNVVEKQPLSPNAYKRQIAIMKSECKWSEAIALVNFYLSIYTQDMEAWSELCALSLRLGRLSHALFAASELVMNDEGNYTYHLLLADVYMTCKPTTHFIKMAQSHYTKSATLRKRGNLRALYGIWLTCTALFNRVNSNDDESSHLLQIQNHTVSAIQAVYKSTTYYQNYHHVDGLLVGQS